MLESVASASQKDLAFWQEPDRSSGNECCSQSSKWARWRLVSSHTSGNPTAWKSEAVELGRQGAFSWGGGDVGVSGAR